jgi:hypothetical protein
MKKGGGFFLTYLLPHLVNAVQKCVVGAGTI